MTEFARTIPRKSWVSRGVYTKAPFRGAFVLSVRGYGTGVGTGVAAGAGSAAGAAAGGAGAKGTEA